MITPNVRLVRPLDDGAGGMGCVWVAEHLALGIEVAVKLIARPELARSAELRARFEREARTAAQIKSPHVVQTLDAGHTSDGTPYIVMELMAGESLERRLQRVGRLTLGRVADIVAQAARALEQAHGAGIVHRDIKPDNIFLVRTTDGDFVKLLDFGIAKDAGEAGENLTRDGAILGSPEYMSPEQLRNAKGVDHRSDLWSLAVVAYRALTGEPCFPGDGIAELCGAILRGQWAKPSTVAPGLPAELDAWFARALQPKPERRFTSARQMAEGLARIAAGEGPRRPAPTVDDLRAPLAAQTVALDAGDIAAALRREPPDNATVAQIPSSLQDITEPLPAERTLVVAAPPAAPAAPADLAGLDRRRWPMVAVPLGVLVAAGLVIAMAARGGGPANAVRRARRATATEVSAAPTTATPTTTPRREASGPPPPAETVTAAPVPPPSPPPVPPAAAEAPVASAPPRPAVPCVPIRYREDQIWKVTTCPP